MDTPTPITDRVHPIAFLVAGMGMMMIAVVLIIVHINTIMEIRDVSVPIVKQLPQLERRLAALTQQVELTELHAATRVGSQQEKVEMYALPKEMRLSRLVATFEVIRDSLKRDGLLSSMTDLEISDPQKRDDGSTVHTVTTKFTLHEEGLKTVMLLVHLSGLLTVGDVLTTEEVALLLDRIEQENPSGIITLEQFLSADLLSYAQNPKAYEEQLKRSFTGTLFLNALENVLRTSLLYDVKILLRSDLGEMLSGYKLWPMQIMAAQEISIEPGRAPKWHTLGLTLEVFSEEK